MEKETLLIELRTEELPPKELDRLSKSFASLVVAGLIKGQLLSDDMQYQVFATPRRLAISIPQVQRQQADQQKIKKGPSLALGLENGNPSGALKGFLKANGIVFEDLSIMHDGKQDIYSYQFVEKGLSIAKILQLVLEMAVKKLPVSKLMHWGDKPFTFVRPVHGLVVMFGSEVLPINLFGFEAGNSTLGHRFMSVQKIIKLKHADDYEAALQQNYVLVSFEARKKLIKEQIKEKCLALNARWVADEALFDEVTGLVEWPVALQGVFEAEFLQIPPECLILTMQKNQKYFPLVNSQEKLLNHFLLISNIESKKPQEVIAGNERVLRARLSDAAFFYDIDRKTSLESRVNLLKNVIYHHQMGSQYDRVQRVSIVSEYIAKQLSIDVVKTGRATKLAKADLVTEMVGEFPELQGVMGKYYALNDKESQEVAEAIEQHYWPKFANDELPHSKLAIAVSLADKLETLVGIWGIGLIPTGDKDPYALRRSALGIIRMLLTVPLNIYDLLTVTCASFPVGLLQDNVVDKVYEFILTRLAIYLQEQYSHSVVVASLSSQPRQFNQLSDILQAMEYFKSIPEAFALAETNKRVSNILKKANFEVTPFDENLIQQPEERELWEAIELISVEIRKALQNKNYQQALIVLTKFKPKVDSFFEQVMVMTENKQIRQNRLNLLYLLLKQLNAVADISYLSQ